MFIVETGKKTQRVTSSFSIQAEYVYCVCVRLACTWDQSYDIPAPFDI